jgi:N-acyl-D-aspartate/D-glutamate deacylase
MPFEVYADGIDLVVFEEFGAGEEALHLTEQVQRNQLFAGPGLPAPLPQGVRQALRAARVAPRLSTTRRSCRRPDASLAGRSFGEVADERGEHPVDTFLDL